MRAYQIILILLLCSVAFFFSCENDEKEVQKITGNKAILPTMEGKEVDVDYRDSGLVVLKMHANHIKQFERNVAEPYYEADKGLKVLFYDKDGKEVSTLTAEYGIYYQRTQRVEVKYKVVVVNKEGKRLETEKLSWRQNDSIRSEGQVILFENGRKLVGKKLVAAQDFSHMELNDISMSLPVEDTDKK